MIRTLQQRAEWVVDQACICLCERIEGGAIQADNEASYQLHLASIIKSFGEAMLSGPSELFHIELEKVVKNSEALFLKSGSLRASIDIWFAISSPANNTKFSVAIEIKYFKKKNHREPNNRVDVFKDILNLENYGEHADVGVMLVFTDHAHYVNQAAYSEDTADFDFRNERSYAPNTVLTYKTQTPYVQPLSLRGQYQFNWLAINEKSFMLKLSVNTQLAVVAN